MVMKVGERKLIAARCKQLIATLETNPNSRSAQAFVRDVATRGSWGWDFWIFLRWHPEFRSKLEKAWLAATKVAEKAEMKRLKREAEKQHTKALLKAIQTEATARAHTK